MNEEPKYACVDTFYKFAERKGYKVNNFKLTERHNRKGRYFYAEVAFIVPIKEKSKLMDIIEDIEKDTYDNCSAEAQKEEVSE